MPSRVAVRVVSVEAPVTGDPIRAATTLVPVVVADDPVLHSTRIRAGADVVEVSDRLGLTRLYCCARHHSSRCFAATCGNFRGMRLAGAFFANHAEVVDDMLNVEGGVWATHDRRTALDSLPVQLRRAARHPTPRRRHPLRPASMRQAPPGSAGRRPGRRTSSFPAR